MGIDEFLRPLLPWLGGGTASIVSMPHLIAVEIRLEFAEIIRGKPVVLRLLIGRGAERHGCHGRVVGFAERTGQEAAQCCLGGNGIRFLPGGDDVEQVGSVRDIDDQAVTYHRNTLDVIDSREAERCQPHRSAQ